jgi:hypothetical protein
MADGCRRQRISGSSFFLFFLIVVLRAHSFRAGRTQKMTSSSVPGFQSVSSGDI